MKQKERIKNKKGTTTYIAGKSVEWYERHFDTVGKGATFAAEALPALYAHGLAALKGVFTVGELHLIIDVMNGVFLMGGLIGQHITADCEDGITLNGLDKKWKIDAAEFLKKLHARNILELAALEIWAHGYWVNFEDVKIEAWALQLAK